MIWNFDYTIPSLIVLAFFLFFYFLKPVLLSQSNRLFLYFIIFEVIGFFVTSFSCYIDSHSLNYPYWLLVFFNSIYYISFVARYFLISMFFASLLKVKIKRDIPTIIVSIITVGIIIIILLKPSFIYKLTPSGRFERADSFLLIYFVNIITLVLDSYYVIRFGRKLEAREIVSLVFSILVLSACCMMDIIYVNYLITDMFFIFVLLILYLAFENPDIYLDNKTGLYNFQAFSYLVQEYLFRKKKYSIITFIIQNYPEKKQIYGVTQMDEGLKEIGNFFSSLFHNKKCFYLQNGKFAVVDKKNKHFKSLSEKVLERFKQPWIVNNAELNLNILVIDIDDDVEFNSIEDIMSGFGIAYTEAKKFSVDHIVIDRESFDEIIRKTKIAKALDRAIVEDSLLVYMQPIVDSLSRKIIAAEALVRIYDEELGVIPPGEFILMAEKNGSIEQLGEQVLNKVCIFLKESQIYKYGIQWINVNLSPVQCQNNKLPEKIDNITNMSTIDHKYIHLEITEDSMIDYQILDRQMNILVTNGYKFSLDDFGSGFSNITRLKKFPFNNVKLDMSIIKDYFSSPDNMLPGIVKNFADRGLSVTAEGVETKEMADELEKMGCDFLQGYYFSKPIPSKDFSDLIKSQL